MPRRSWVHRVSKVWAAATLTAVAPTLYFWVVSILTGDYGSRSYISTYWGSCLGWDIYDQVSPWAYPIKGFPLFSYGGVPLIVLGCAGWYLSLRSGRARLGRIIGRCVGVVLLVLSLLDFLPPTLDAALGTGLTTRGPGSYRIRVHLRGRTLATRMPDPPDGAVELLIMVFPGTAKKPVAYK